MSFGFGVGDFLAVLQLVNNIRKNVANGPREFQVLDVELRALSLTIHDADVRLDNSSSQQQESLRFLHSECRNILCELQEYVGKFVELQAPNNTNAKSDRARHIKRLWKGLQWDSSVITSFQNRITSIVTKINALSQREIKQDIEVLVEYEDLHRRWGLIEWISPVDYATTQRDILAHRVDLSAGKWLLHSEDFKAWLTGMGKTLFCPGIPGAGKTMMTAVTVEHLQSVQPPSMLTGYVYCTYQSHNQSAPQLLGSVLRSLVQQLPKTPRFVQDIFNSSYKLDKRHMTPEQVISAITELTRSKMRTNVVVDALDELARDDRGQFIEALLEIQRKAGLNLMFTTRFHAEIESKLADSLKIVIRATEADVRRYLWASITLLPRFVAKKDELQVAIVQGIIDATDGMFLLAQLHLNSLKHKTSPKEIREALARLSSGSDAYDKAYMDALDRINSQVREPRILAQKTLAILVTARRALAQQELCHALAVSLEPEDVDVDEDVRDIEDVLAVCAGLVAVDTESDVVRLVHKSTQEYFERNRMRLFPDAEYFMGTTCAVYLKCMDKERENAPFYNYADGHWYSHLDEATRQRTTADSDPIRNETETSRSPGDSKLAEELSVRLGINLFSTNPALYSTMIDACKRGDQSLLEALIDMTKLNIAEDHRLLSAAVGRRQCNIVKLLLRRSAKPDSLHASTGRPVVFRAIELREPEILKLLLDYGADRECKSGDDGETPLLWAARKGSLSCVEVLVKVADVSAVDEAGRNALSIAIIHHHDILARTLLPLTEDSAIRVDNQGRTALHHVVLKGSGDHRTMVALLQVPEAQRRLCNGDDQSVLCLAVERDLLAMVRAMLDFHWVSPDWQDEDGYSPLHRSVMTTPNVHRKYYDENSALSGNDGIPSTEMLQLLLDRGANVNAVDRNGRTALIHAVDFIQVGTQVDVERVQILLAAPGVDVNVVSKVGAYGGETALSTAMFSDDIYMNLLRRSGASYNVPNELGFTTMHHFAFYEKFPPEPEECDFQTVEYNCRDKLGRTPIFFVAAFSGDIDDSASLGATMNITDHENWFPAHYLAVCPYAEDFKAEHGDINCKGPFGLTPFHMALRMDWPKAHTGSREWLKFKEVDVNRKDDFGNTPIDHAAKQAVRLEQIYGPESRCLQICRETLGLLLGNPNIDTMWAGKEIDEIVTGWKTIFNETSTSRSEELVVQQCADRLKELTMYRTQEDKNGEYWPL